MPVAAHIVPLQEHALFSLLALEEVNKTSVRGGMKIEFYKIDTRSPETAPLIAEYRRACADKSVPMFLANSSSKQLFAIYEYAKACNMATFAPTSGPIGSSPIKANGYSVSCRFRMLCSQLCTGQSRKSWASKQPRSASPTTTTSPSSTISSA